MYMKKIVVLSLSSLFLFACSQNNGNNNEQTNSSLQVEQSSYEQNEALNNNEIANHLAELATEVPDVEDANAIIAGPYAIVAIDVDKDTKKQRVGTIKYSVSEALRNDPYGKTAVVIADADVSQRIREMRLKMEEGHVIHGIVDELAEIVARYMPTFPAEQNPPVEQEENMMERYPEGNSELEGKDIRKAPNQKE